MSPAANRPGGDRDPDRGGSGSGHGGTRPPAPGETRPERSGEPLEEREERMESQAPEDAVVEESAEAATPAGAEENAAADASAFQDRWLRAEADLQNFRRRAAKDLEEARRYSEEAVMLDMIGLLDDLERGIEAARAAGAADAWLQGIELVAARMRDTLARRGVEPIDPAGQPFDPGQHEALLEVPASEGQRPGDVAQVVLKGYRRGGRPLRAARVVVARAPTPADEGD